MSNTPISDVQNSGQETFAAWKRKFSKRAFTLVETTLSLGVAGFCLLSIFGLLPVGLNSNQTAIRQNLAGNISSAIITDLRSAGPLGLSSSPRFGLNIPSAPATSGTMQTVYLSASGIATAVNQGPVTNPGASSIYRATVFFAPPQPGQNYAQRNATQVRVLITWPALADSDPTKGPASYNGSYDAQTALDCN